MLNPFLLTIECCTFTNCKSTSTDDYYGGAVAAYHLLKADISCCAFTRCSAAGNGGALYLHPRNSSLTLALGICGCLFSGCYSLNSGYDGGSVCANLLTTSSITNSTFSKCESRLGLGGALYLHRSDGVLTFADVQFTDNKAGADDTDHPGHDIYLAVDPDEESEFSAETGVTLTNTFTLPCSSFSTNIQSVTDQLLCQLDYHTTFYISPLSAGCDCSCIDIKHTACISLKDIVVRVTESDVNDNGWRVEVVEGVYLVSEAIKIKALFR